MNVRPWWLLPPGRIQPAWWIALGAVVLWVDDFTGLNSSFPVVYAVPVILAAWYSGKGTAIALAVAVPICRMLAFVWAHGSEDGLVSFGLATGLRGVVVLVVGLWFARLADYERDLNRHVKVLEGMLPICSFCKSIRNENGRWEHLESFISRRSQAEFSHGVCPSCGAAHYPGLVESGGHTTSR